MPQGIEAKIINGLLEHVEDFSTSPAIPLAWPDPQVPFEKPLDGQGRPKPYLQVFEIPVPTIPRALKGTNQYSGVLQISLFWPERSGVIAPEEIRSQICAHFDPRILIPVDGFNIQITQASRNGSLKDAPYVHYPISIRYRALAAVSA